MEIPKIANRFRGLLRGGFCAGIAVLAFCGAACVDILAQNGPAALRTAESRAQFEMNCPQVQTTVISQKTIEGVRFEGSEHTIGVRGCGKQAVYVVYCRDPRDCNALAQTDRGITAIPNP
jgi:hypothetical protein